MTTTPDERLIERTGTRVTATDLKTGESTTWEIRDTYVLIVDGRCYLDGQQVYGNGTHALTVKRAKRLADEADLCRIEERMTESDWAYQIQNVTTKRLIATIRAERTEHAALVAVVQEAVAAIRHYDDRLPTTILAGVMRSFEPAARLNVGARQRYDAIRALAAAAKGEVT